MADLYVGSYGPQHNCHGQGVVTMRLDPATGWISEPQGAVLADSPGYLALSHSGRTVYAAHLIDDGRISALARSPQGRLRLLGSVATAGNWPCHVLARRHQLVVSNFQSGSLAVVRLAADESMCGPAEVTELADATTARRAAHPHGAWELPFAAGQIVISDLGLDALTVFDIGDSGLTAPGVSAAPAGAGPRHIALAASGDAFVSDELGSSVSRYRYDHAQRRFRLVASAPSTELSGTNYPSGIVVAPDASRAYVLNRGSESISIFDISAGQLQMLAEVGAGGKWPLHCLLLQGWLYVAAMNSDQIIVHALDARTGIPSREERRVDVLSPTCLLAAPEAGA